MTETMRQLLQRKSVRAFTGETIPEPVRDEILQCVFAAPTAGNQQMYTIIEVAEPQRKQTLSELCDHQPFIATADWILVFCADYRKWYDLFLQEACLPRKPEEGDLMLAVTDACIAAQNAVTAAESAGIGSCYIGDIMENCEAIRAFFRLPDYVFPCAMLVFGYPTEQQRLRPKPERFRREDILCREVYRPLSPEERTEMFARHAGQQDLQTWTQAFCKRKYNSDFSVEMSRSVRQYIRQFAPDDAASEAEQHE